jgi:hypothetical protein
MGACGYDLEVQFGIEQDDLRCGICNSRRQHERLRPGHTDFLRLAVLSRAASMKEDSFIGCFIRAFLTGSL